MRNDRRPRSGVCARPASSDFGVARIDRRPVRIARPRAGALALGHQRRNLGAAFEARIQQSLRLEPRQRGAIVVEMLALPPHRLLPCDAEPGEILEDRLLVFRPAAGLVDVLDAQQQAPARRPRHVEIQQRGQRMADMQIAVRGRRKAENGCRHAPFFGIPGANDKPRKNLQDGPQTIRWPMKYSRNDAKAYARTHLSGIWAAAQTPFKPDLSIDEAGLRRNLRHWVDDLGVDGVFVSGKQGEFFSMSLAERKRTFEIAVDEIGGARTILSCSDQNLNTVIELAKHAQAIGSDFIVVHAPVLHFLSAQDETLMAYYRAISEQVDIGIALWSHPDSGYLMSPELCARVAELPNVVAIKYSVPREMYVKLTRLAGDKLIVSTASEDEWFDNIVELDWRLYLCSSPPYVYQTAIDRRMRDYTDLAFKGDIARARAVRDSLDPVREAFKRTRPAEKFHAHSKYWQELLGQAGGAVRAPLLELTEAEKDATRRAFESCGLKVPNVRSSAA